MCISGYIMSVCGVGVWKVDVWSCESEYMRGCVGVLTDICVGGWRSYGLCISRYWGVCEGLSMFYTFC